MRRSTIVAAALAVAILSSAAHAESVGVYGNVWEIAEPDAIDTIKNHLRRQEKDGTVKRMWQDAQRKTLEGLENPPPVPGITTATEPRTWTFDPAFTFNETVRDHLGNVLVPAGTRVNPLDYTSLTKAYIFIDGRDDAQLKFAKARIDANPLDRVVLTAGSFMKLDREWGVPVYYDQKGNLTRYFGIKRVPAVLTQRGKLLQIEELPQ